MSHMAREYPKSIPQKGGGVNLRALIEEILLESSEPNLDKIVEEVMARTSNASLRDAYQQALHIAVRQVNSIVRIARPPTHSDPIPRVNRAGRNVQIGQGWRRQLRMRYTTESGDKFLGEFTYEDCVWAATRRYNLAERNKAQGDRFMRAARALRDHQVTFVSALPEAVQREIW